MSNRSHFFNKVEKYFKSQKNKILKFFDYNKDYTFKFYYDNNNDQHIIELYHNNKKILKAEYSIIGMYNMINSIWYWGWDIDFINKKLIKQSELVKKFNENIKKNYDTYDPIEAEELFYITSNSNFYISAEKVKKITKLFLYLVKGLWIIPICYGKNGINSICDGNENTNNIQKIKYILITKIIQVG